MERCPDKFMTLVKALGNKDDREYYKQFCKEGVDMTKVSSGQERTHLEDILIKMITVNSILIIVPTPGFCTVV